MSLADEIQKLEDLRRQGVLTEEEFAQGKKRLLRQDGLGNSLKESFEQPDERTWGLIIHLSQFLGYLVPLLGFVVPIVIWQTMKDKSEIMDIHGIHVTNWMISLTIYVIAFYLLSLVVIGIPFLVAATIAAVVFPIVAALKAQNLETWRYPFSIPFFAPRVLR